MAATSSTITTVGNKAIDNYTLGGSFDKSSFMTSLGSIQTWGGVASSALTTGINLKTAEKLKRLGEKGAAISKFYGGAINLGTSFAGKGAEFGTYAIDALANGRGLYSAYDNMGGISMNVASLGAMMDFAGTMMSRNNKSGQSAMSVLAEAFRGQGIYEINIGTNGITGKFGNGGIDVGGNVYDLAKRMSDKSNLAKYASSNGQAKGEAAYYAYVYGDWTQENTAARIANGKDTLIFDNTNDFIARTERDAKGGRTITMRNSGDKYVNAIQLGHESYRNGIIGTTAEQNAETIAAVMGHTEMAVRMEDYQSYKAQGLLGAEVEAYRKGDMTSLFMNAMANYDSSGDYWKLTVDGKIEWDKSKNLNVEYYDEWGNLKTKKGYITDDTGSYSLSLLNYVGEERARQILGFDFDNLDNFKADVVKSVLGENCDVSNLSAAERQTILQNNRDKLIAESLMYNQGKNWSSEKGWSGDFASLKMTDDPTIGQVIINKTDDGYERFGITAKVTRNPLSSFSTRKNPRDPNYKSYQGLDYITFYKKDLNGKVLDRFTSAGWQTVSNGYTSSYIDTNTPQAYPWLGNSSVYRDDSVSSSSSFNIRAGNFTHDHYKGPIFVISDFTTIGGTSFGATSSTNGRTLLHSDMNWDGAEYSQSSYGKISAACFVNSYQALENLQNNLNNWNVPNYPYNIKSSFSTRVYRGR